MGYFSNGTEAMDYEAHFCAQCIHGQNEEQACPIFQMHFLYAYELCNKKGDPGKVILDALIPRTGRGGNAQCALFAALEPKPEVPRG